jgi:hypothetical protein
MSFEYVCSLGPHCHSSQLLKDNKLKRCSYPYDWIFSNVNMILHTIENNFKIFLDKTYYINISTKQCGHSYYHNNMFNHFNPLINIDDYNYYIRCVDRFTDLLNNKEAKLFVMLFFNINNISEFNKNNIINFNNIFSTYTTNYKILIIINIHNKEQNYHNFTHNDNIDFLELHTLSSSNGVTFKNNNDNTYLNNIINNMYVFNNKIE